MFLNHPIAIEKIRCLQREEGSVPCFRTGKEFCNRKECCWREICLGKFKPKALITFRVVD